MAKSQSALMSLNAESFRLKKINNNDSYKLSLFSPDDGIVFGDRPSRHAEVISIGEVAAIWKNAFRGDPPNAVFSFSNGSKGINGVFEIRRFNRKKNKIDLSIKFSEGQKTVSDELLSSDFLTGKSMPHRSSLFIDNISWDAGSGGSWGALQVQNNAGNNVNTDFGSMKVVWSNSGDAKLFNSQNQAITVSNGQSTSTDPCAPQIVGGKSGLDPDGLQVEAQVYFSKGTQIDTWWVGETGWGTPWISKNQGAEKHYGPGTFVWDSQDFKPITGITQQNGYNYPYTITYENSYSKCPDADTYYKVFNVEYGLETPITS